MNATATKTEKKGLKTYTFDPAKYMKSRVAMQEYLNVSIEEDLNIKMLISSFEDLIRAWALSKLARKTKIKQIDLCEILLGDVEPTPEIFTKIAEALGLKMPAEFYERFGLQPEKTAKTSIPYTHHKHTEQPHFHVNS
ncbi:MAG: hypothetical protein J6P00_05170 [Acetobacter sp.]|nr:hypothetical protein [Acetobacter sp.]